MSFLSLLPQISIPPMEVGGVDDPAVASRFADRLRKQLEDMQQDLQDDDQLEVVAFLHRRQLSELKVWDIKHRP